MDGVQTNVYFSETFGSLFPDQLHQIHSQMDIPSHTIDVLLSEGRAESEKDKRRRREYYKYRTRLSTRISSCQLKFKKKKKKNNRRRSMPKGSAKPAALFPNDMVRTSDAASIDEVVIGLENFGREIQSIDMFSVDMLDNDPPPTTAELADESSDFESPNASEAMEDDGSRMFSDMPACRALSKEFFGSKLKISVTYPRFAAYVSLRNRIVPLVVCWSTIE